MPGAPRRAAYAWPYAKTMPVLADAGYDGAGRKRTDPDQAAHRRPPLHADQHTYNMLLRGLRCLGKRGMIS